MLVLEHLTLRMFYLLCQEPDTLRVVLMVLSAVVVVFPITLLRNVNKLSVISMASFIFYFCLILLLCYSSTGHLFSKGLWTDISWWETKGIIKCLPIFSLAFCCQRYLNLTHAHV